MFNEALACAGPLFYPPVGKIAIMQSGCRIAVWADEGNSEGAFTGQLLDENADIQTARAYNLSVFWDRSRIVRMEEATASDKSLSLIDMWVEAVQ